MINKPIKNDVRKKRHARLRNKISGTQELPRLSVFKSNKEIYAQLIDDTKGFTLVAASSKDANLKDSINELSKIEVATLIGKEIAKKAKKQGIEACVFDRSGYLYHGRVKSLADGAREAGLKF